MYDIVKPDKLPYYEEYEASVKSSVEINGEEVSYQINLRLKLRDNGFDRHCNCFPDTGRRFTIADLERKNRLMDRIPKEDKVKIRSYCIGYLTREAVKDLEGMISEKGLEQIIIRNEGLDESAYNLGVYDSSRNREPNPNLLTKNTKLKPIQSNKKRLVKNDSEKYKSMRIEWED